MLTKVAPWIAMTNAMSTAATCARAEVPLSSVSDGCQTSEQRPGNHCRDAVLLRYLWVPYLLIGWELCEATDICALATVRRVMRRVRRSGRARKASNQEIKGAGLNR